MDFKEFGKQISILRKEKKVSQEKLSIDLNISRATISSLENGKNSDVGIKKVLQILDYLGFDLQFKQKNRFPTFEELRDEK